MFGRNKLATLVAEFLGVAVLVLAILSISKSGVGFSLFLAGGLGVAAIMLVLVLGKTIAGYFNPGVTVGLWTTGRLSLLQALGSLASQFLGAFAAWKLYEYLTDQPLQAVGAQNFDVRVFVAEMLGTLLLTFGIAAAIYQAQSGLRWASTVGASVFLGVLVASVASNGIINPAVALGVQSFSWAYITAPFVGGILGANLYALLYAPVDGNTRNRFNLARVRGVVVRRNVRTQSTTRKKSRR